MANTERRSNYTDKNGNMFMPMNVEGGIWNENFITTPKLICLAVMAISLFVIIIELNSNNAPVLSYVIYLLLWAIASLYATRFIIFEEKMYYRMYQEYKKNEISTPALFWDIASIKNTDEGAILTYSDAKIGILVKLDRDTITGKSADFKEIHYDAISDCYRSIAMNNYSFIQMNIMEQAGNDPRLNELTKIINKSDNPNICKLMELEVGHIKNITHKSLYESDYFLFYTEDVSKVDTIIQDITECLFKILDGAYIGFSVLSGKDIVEFVKENNGVTYFNSTKASLTMFNRNSANIANPFNITGLAWNDGEAQTLTKQEIVKLRNITSGVIRETVKQRDISLKDALYREDINNKIGVDFNSLSGEHYEQEYDTSNMNVKQDLNDVSFSNPDDDEFIDLYHRYKGEITHENFNVWWK